MTLTLEPPAVKLRTNSQGESRVRAQEKLRAKLERGKVVPAIMKSLLDALDEGDIAAVVRVYREAMLATRRYWRNGGKSESGQALGEWITEPDHRSRLAAANMVAAYLEGLPVQRQIQFRGDFVELGELLGGARQSGEAMRLMPRVGTMTRELVPKAA